MQQPWVVLVVLEGGKPHQPVEAIVVGRYDAGAPAQATRLAFELKLLPVGLRINSGVPSALEDYFCTFLSDTVGEGERIVNLKMLSFFPFYLPKAPYVLTILSESNDVFIICLLESRFWTTGILR